MAGGKLSPRQKMINLMYLVFIAMLALNMSKEVLSAFGLLDNKIAKANTASDQRNQAFIAGLAEKASEQPAKYQPLQAKAEEVNTMATELDTYITNLKGEMMSSLGEKVDPNDYEVQDKPDFLDTKFFAGDNLSPEGQEFVTKVNNFREGIVKVVGQSYPNIAADVKDKFKTTEETNRDGKKIDWLKYNFEGFPLIASKTKLTQMQADIKTTQNEMLSALLAGEQVKQLSMANYQAIVVPDKTAFFSGENFKGKVVLGRFDGTMNFEKVIINGKEMDKPSTGQVVLDFPAGNVGEQTIKGQLQFKQGDSIVPLDFETSYAVISRPNSATISADKMNVVYRGVDNPMTISFAGIPDNNVNANATGLSRVSGSKYMMRPTAGREVVINVSGKLPDGSNVGDKKTFRIKDIPAPVGAIRGETGSVRIERGGLEISTVSAILEDFDFELKLNVSGFSFRVSGQPTVKVSGTRLNDAAKAALRRAGRGETVQIFDINAKVEGSGVLVKKVAPIIIELTN